MYFPITEKSLYISAHLEENFLKIKDDVANLQKKVDI
jgi:hypothetical protein